MLAPLSAPFLQNNARQATLLFQCADQPGIVMQLSQWVFQQGGNIMQSAQYSSHPQGGDFFMRLVFCFDEALHSPQQLEASLLALGNSLKGHAKLYYATTPKRFAVLVSRSDHCLYELLYHWQQGELVGEVTAIISNHRDCERLAQQFNLPFHHLPIEASNKAQQEAALLKLTHDTTDFLVLARYMQILSPAFLRKYPHDIINIHHSFLPSFVGANPYQQAHRRGVKLIGATAHFVTAELDEGPIIEQLVTRVSHQDNSKRLQQKGAHLERQTLLQAVSAYCEHRVIRHENKTIVFE